MEVAGSATTLGSIETPKLAIKQIQQGARLKCSPEPFDLNQLPSYADLLATSNVYALTAIVVKAGFIVCQNGALRQAFRAADRNGIQNAPVLCRATINAVILSIRFARSDTKLLVSVQSGQLLVYDLKALVGGQQSDPSIITLPAEPVLVSPNPSPEKHEFVAILTVQGQIALVNLDSLSVVSTYGQNITSICWSVRGKQIVSGTNAGELVQLSPEGESKATIAAPPSLNGPHKVVDVRWLENDVFMVTYASLDQPNANTPMDTPIYIITRSKQEGNSFANFTDDPTLAIGVHELRHPRRFGANLRGWTPFKHLLVLANSACSAIGVFAQQADANAWATLDLEESSRPSLPNSIVDEDMGNETAPLGLDFDLSTLDDIYKLPVMLAYNSDGLLSAWNVSNEDSQCPLLVQPGDILKDQPAIQPDAPQQSQATPVKAFASQPSAFAQPSAFGTSSGFGTTSGFGATSGFGSSSPFGTKSTFGSSAPPTSTSGNAFSAFAQSSSTGSAFGSTTSSAFSGFGQKPAAGFGSFAAPNTGTNVFGAPSSTFGGTPSFSSLGSTPRFGGARGMDDEPVENNTPKVKAPGLEDDADSLEPKSKGDASASLGFGAFGLGGSSKPAPNPSISSTPSAPSFGAKTTFGSAIDDKAPAFGQPSPSFGSTSTAPAFGTSNTPSPFGQPSRFGTFGTTSKPSAFSGFGVPASSSSSTSTPTTTSTSTVSAPASTIGFGAFAKPATSSSSTTFSFGKALASVDAEPKESKANSDVTSKDLPTQEAPKSSSPFSLGSTSTTPFSFGSPSPFSASAFSRPSAFSSNQASETTNTKSSDASKIEVGPKDDKHDFSFSKANTQQQTENASQLSAAPSVSASKQQADQVEDLEKEDEDTQDPSLHPGDEQDAHSEAESEEQEDDEFDEEADQVAEEDEVNEEEEEDEEEEEEEEGEDEEDPTLNASAIDESRQVDEQKDSTIPNNKSEAVDQTASKPFAPANPSPLSSFASFKSASSSSGPQTTSQGHSPPASSKPVTSPFAFPTTSTRRLSSDYSNLKPTKASSSPKQEVPSSSPSPFPLPQSSQNNLFGLKAQPASSTQPRPQSAGPSLASSRAPSPSNLGSANSQQAAKPSSTSLQPDKARSDKLAALSNARPVLSRPASQTRLSDVVVPRLSDGAAASPQVPKTAGLAGEAQKMIRAVDQEMELLKKNIVTCTNFISGLREPLQPIEGAPVSLTEEEWTLGDLSRLQDLDKIMRADVKDITQSQRDLSDRAGALRNGVFAADLKKEEAWRFIRSTADPDFKRMLQIQKLGPEQAENQQRLRSASLSVANALDQLEGQVNRLQARIDELQAGRSVLQAPTLEAIDKAIKNIAATAQSKIAQLDELSIRLDMHFLSVKTDQKLPKFRPRSNATDTAMPQTQDESQAEAQARAQRAIDMRKAGQTLKNVILSSRKAPAVVEMQTSAHQKAHQLSALDQSLAQGPLANNSFKMSPKRRSPFGQKPLSSTLSPRDTPTRNASPLARNGNVFKSQSISTRPSFSFKGIAAEESDSEGDSDFVKA